MKKMIILILILIPVIWWFSTPQEVYESTGEVEIPQNEYDSSRLSIHIFPSPYGINWDSPLSLLLSSAANRVSKKNRQIGHMAVELQCLNPEGETTFYTFTGMSDTGKDVFDLLIKKKIGFGIINKLHPGILEDTSMLQKELKAKRKEGRVHSVTFKISPQSCKNLQNFLKEYKEQGVDKHYGGLQYKVREKVGAGCVHFAYSFADIANLENEPFLEGWLRDVFIPKSLIGKMGEKEVSIFSMFLNPEFYSWAEFPKTAQQISFWDIDAIFKKLSNTSSSPGVTLRKRGESKEFIIDKTSSNDFEIEYWTKVDK